jgi:hypothetical protein
MLTSKSACLFIFGNVCGNCSALVSFLVMNRKRILYLPLGSVWLDQVGVHRMTVDAQ